MAVRRAVVADLPRIIEYVQALTLAIDGPCEVDPKVTRETLLHFIANPNAAVFVSDAGFLAGSLGATLISSERFAHECGWFAKDGSGVRLLKAFEAFAAQHGARVRLSTASWEATPPKLRIWLQARGYRPVETAWVN